MEKIMHFLKLVSFVASILVLSSCGGGGGSSTPAVRALSGVAAVGTPIVNGTINVICAAGSALAPTVTASTGAWQVTLSRQTLPCAVQVSGGTINGVINTTPYDSIATTTGTVNITPLTDLLVANLVGAATPSTWFAGLSTNPAPLTTITQTQVNATLAKMSTALSGLTPLSTNNPITTAFTPTSGNVSDDMLTALATAMAYTGVTYESLLSDASTTTFTAPPGFGTALATAYNGTTSGGGIGFLNSVTWSGTQFVAVGSGGIVVTSPDGIIWTSHASPISLLTGATLNSVAWLGTQFFAVGSNGGSAICLPPKECPDFIVANYAMIVTSPDGLTWTSQLQSALPTVVGSALNGVTWSGTQFVTVGANGTILTSPTGTAWAPQTPGTINTLNGVTWSGTQFAAVGVNGTILTSPTGTAWTPQSSGTISTLNGVTWSGTQFVAVGVSGTILTSPDGITWTPQTSGALDTLNGVTWSGTQFVAVGVSGTILTSPDGITWTLRISGTANALSGVTWSGTQFVAVGAGTILTSPDGITWTLRTSP